MTAHAFATRRSVTLSALAGLALLLGTAPAHADTTTVSKTGGGYTVRVTNEAGSGAANIVSVSEDANGNLLVEDSAVGVDVVAGANCSQQTADRVSCPPDPTATATLEITTGLANDQIGLSHTDRGGTGIVSTLVNSGAGADSIAGGPAPERLTGDGLTGAGGSPLANTAPALE
ncbi:MAG: hypothetical protein LC777_06510, partial [Actinobacteria bacterium]|nr:hypothetical protein [Actinomycetota bacterium]